MRSKESILQSGCVEWFRLAFAPYKKRLFAIPNGGSRHKIEAKHLKEEGVLAGVGDLFLMVANHGYNGLFIEMKYGNNTQKQPQKEFEQECKKAGYKYVVCWTFDEFRDTMIEYLTV